MNMSGARVPPARITGKTFQGVGPKNAYLSTGTIMASTIWKGYLSFGLISIPLRLFAAARSEHVSFHQIHKVCNTRIKQQLYCPHCERVVERSELAKGYEIDKGRWVVVEDEEIKRSEERRVGKECRARW